MNRKWILTKELFDSGELKIQHEVGDTVNTYVPIGEDKMLLNHLLLQVPYLSITFHDQSQQNFATYEQEVYLFVFQTERYRLNLALDLFDTQAIDLAICIFDLTEDLATQKPLSSAKDGISLDEVVNYLNTEVLEIFKNLGFTKVIAYNEELTRVRMN